VSRQAFPRKIGKKVRGVSETHVFHNIAYACSICGILALGIAGTHRQLCITDYKYRKAAGKKHYFNWFAHQAFAYTIFVSKGHLPEWASDRQSALARHEILYLSWASVFFQPCL